MGFINKNFISLILLVLFSLSYTNAATFDIRNNCPYRVWAAAVPTGGGRALDQGQTWTINVPAGTAAGRIWPRTGCNFNGAGQGSCQTGDCGRLECQGYGRPPSTIAEFALNQFQNLDFFDLSLVNGFNVPMEFSPTSGGCSSAIKCTADINRQCPTELRAPGGCNNPCTVYQTAQYCCTAGANPCGPTDLSRFFKQRCPDACSYAQDDETSIFTCPGETNYRVVFCP